MYCNHSLGNVPCQCDDIWHNHILILLNILAGWVIPPENQPEMMKESKYFQLAGSFAKSIEELIPEATRNKLHQQMTPDEEVAPGVVLDSDLDDLFEKLTQPQIEKKEIKEKEEEPAGYDSSEQKSLDRLIEMTADE